MRGKLLAMLDGTGPLCCHKSENFQIPAAFQIANGLTYNPAFHGTSGPLKTGYINGMINGTIGTLFNDTLANVNIEWNNDMNSGKMHGLDSPPKTIDQAANIREDAARAYYWPIANRTNLALYQNKYANKLIWASTKCEDAVASGVEVVLSNGTITTIYAIKEICPLSRCSSLILDPRAFWCWQPGYSKQARYPNRCRSAYSRREPPRPDEQRIDIRRQRDSIWIRQLHHLPNRIRPVWRQLHRVCFLHLLSTRIIRRDCRKRQQQRHLRLQSPELLQAPIRLGLQLQHSDPRNLHDASRISIQHGILDPPPLLPRKHPHHLAQRHSSSHDQPQLLHARLRHRCPSRRCQIHPKTPPNAAFVVERSG